MSVAQWTWPNVLRADLAVVTANFSTGASDPALARFASKNPPLFARPLACLGLQLAITEIYAPGRDAAERPVCA